MSESTEDKTKHLVERALRKKTGINERLLCMRLIQATFATDIKPILVNTCMAASMVEEGYSDIEGFDFQKFRIMKQVYNDLKRTEFKRLAFKVKKHYYDETQYTLVCPVPWSIPQTKEVFESYISPWLPVVTYRQEGLTQHKRLLVGIVHVEYSYNSGRGCGQRIDLVPVKEANAKMQEWIGKTCPKCKTKIEKVAAEGNQHLHVVREPCWSYWFEVSQCIDHDGFKKLSSAFYEWVINECGKAIMVMGRLVSHNIYEEVLKQLRGEPEKQEEKQGRK